MVAPTSEPFVARMVLAAGLLALAFVGVAHGSESSSRSRWSRFQQPADSWNELRPAATIAVAAASDVEQDSASGDQKPEDACKEADGECRDALAKLRGDTLASIDLDIRIGGQPGNDYPCECRLEGETYQPRRFATTTFTWKAAGYCHKPLYFEHWTLERYGHSYGFVPDVFLSGAHFFVTLPILPYKMGVEPPWECVYPLGYYRPGNCAPWTCPAVPISGRGLAVEAAAITGAVFLLP